MAKLTVTNRSTKNNGLEITPEGKDKGTWKTMSEKVAAYINKLPINQVKGREVAEYKLSEDKSKIVYLKLGGGNVQAQTVSAPQNVPSKSSESVVLLSEIAENLKKIINILNKANKPASTTEITDDDLSPMEEVPKEFTDTITEADLEDF